MLTPADHIKNKINPDGVIWVSGLDAIEHCLQKDTHKTMFKHASPVADFWDEWNAAMKDQTVHTDQFQDVYNNAYTYKEQYIETIDDSGSLDVGAYIGGEDLCFNNEQKLYAQGPACSVILDIVVPYYSRGDNYMIERQQKVYDLVAQCDSENRPIQIVGAVCIKIPEHAVPLKIFILIKDYADSIYPSIWGSLKNNKSTNAFLNVIMDYFIGTRDLHNGLCTSLRDVENYFQDNEELVIYSDKYIQQSKGPKR